VTSCVQLTEILYPTLVLSFFGTINNCELNLKELRWMIIIFNHNYLLSPGGLCVPPAFGTA
jgi:hypothetical protein